MDERHTPGGRARPVIPSRLILTPQARSETQDSAEDAVLWALALLRENEAALIDAGREHEIAFGRWLTNPHSTRRYKHEVAAVDMAALIRALVALRLSTDYQPNGRFAQVSSIAAASGLDRGVLFRAFEPRALLLVHLMHAYLVATGDERPWAALQFYAHDGWGSPEGGAYGLHRLTSELTFSRLSGLAALGRDFVVPFSCMPHTVGLRCSPGHLEVEQDVLDRAAAELDSFGIASVPSSHAEHLDFLLRVSAGARGVVEQAREGSRVCGRIRSHPDVLLKRAFPPWLTIGPLPEGVQRRPVLGPEKRRMPGADAQLLNTAVAHGMQPVYVLFDTTETAASTEALQDVVFIAGGVWRTGHQFFNLICSSGRAEIPGLRREPPSALTGLARLEELGVSLEPDAVDWLWHPNGLRLLDGHGGGLGLGLVVRSAMGRQTGYVVLADLENAATRADVIACCDLHFLSDADPAQRHCIDRVFNDYELHALKPWRLSTRTWLRLSALLSNSPVVSVGRSHQARLVS